MAVPGNSRLSERLAVLAAISPITLTTSSTSATSSYVPMTATNGNLFSRYFGVVQTGENGTGTITAQIVKASDTSGTGATAILTATTLAGTNADNKQFVFDVDGVHVDTDKPYIALRILCTETALVSGVLVGGDARYEPASDYDSSSVAEIKTL